MKSFPIILYFVTDISIGTVLENGYESYSFYYLRLCVVDVGGTK